MAIARFNLGRRIAPPRFLTFILLIAIGMGVGIPNFGWAIGSMAAFDIAAMVFFISITPLFNDEANEMRQSAKSNDANRALLLAITCLVSFIVLAAVASELMQKGTPKPPMIFMIIGTLALCWLFSSLIYALHYAHLFYADDQGKDLGGVDFPATKEPDYWDFLYFSTCLSMTFQVSDMNITSRRIRRVVMFHCLAAFVFNLGIIAFTINVLGGG
ncbi:DUF1345 domain-containing protein [Sphingomonas sp. MMS24-J13]|uniref:DUF1345 domain-containing protein n=1 Tax=Sphingomonas sp. MMS24-J13 TaxID=3238686 RepID=UPI00384ACFEF